MQTPDAPPPLSETELEILRSVATGATNREIAHDRGISEATVKKHLTNINAKLGTSNRTEATHRALEMGLVRVGGAVETARSDPEAARRLAKELERTRRRSRHLMAWFVASGVLLVVAAVTLAYAVTATLPGPEALATPAATAAPAPAWLPGVNLPEPLTGAAVVADPNERSVYVLSGRSADGLTVDVLRYDPERLDWRVVTRKPTAVESAGAVTLRGSIVVPGGCLADGTATDVLEIYDPRADAWRNGARLPAPVCAYGLVELDGDALLFGGRSGAGAESARDSVWRYDPEADRWSEEAEMPLPRSDLAAAGDGNRVRLLGGRDRAGRLQASHWVYAPHEARDQRWDAGSEPALPEARAGLVAVRAIGGVFVVGGGWDRRLENGTLVLTPDGSWEPDAPLPGLTPQRGAAMTLGDDGVAVLVGGEVEGRLLNRHYRRALVITNYIPVPIR